MSNLGFTGLYTLLNARDDVVCERAFLPDREDMVYFEEGKEKLLSLESGRLLHAFDVIGFSVSFENDYPNVLKILKFSSVELRSSERGNAYPLVIMGGPCSFMNPEPLADFMDVVFVGEAEEMIDDFIRAIKKGSSKQHVLGTLASVDGFYVPALYDPEYFEDGTLASLKRLYGDVPAVVRRRYLKDLDRFVLASALATPGTEFGTMTLIEAMRGCPFSCRFCAAGHVYNPPRQRSIAVLEREIGKAREKGQRVGLIAPSLTEYRDIGSVLQMNDVHFSITSLRASRKSAEIMGLLRDKKSVSIAPEAGSQRLRDVINKKITEEDILDTAKLILESGIRTLRLYFMLGLPTETDEDVRAITDLTKKIRALSRKGMISLTLSTFVPKPFTPFQWHPMTGMEIIQERIRTVKKGLSLKGVTVHHDVLKETYMQGLFAVGNRRIGDVILQMLEQKDWKRACALTGIEPDFFLYRRKRFEEILPWDFIDNGIPKKKLWEEYLNASGVREHADQK
jgi:radical SAM superfamily enzyme YgiQ (UPF0313 family)